MVSASKIPREVKKSCNQGPNSRVNPAESDAEDGTVKVTGEASAWMPHGQQRKQKPKPAICA